MPDHEIQPGETFTLGLNVRLVAKEKGESTRFDMLIKGGYAIVNEQIKSGAAYRLLFKLIEDMKPRCGNTMHVNFTDLAEHYNVDTKAVHKLFKLFLNADIIRRIKKGHYLINPDIVWNGYTRERILAVEDWNKGKTYYKDEE